jgi:hypothetical protein
MMKTLTLAATTMAMIGGAVLPATAADAHRYRRAPHSDRYYRGYNDGARAEYQASKCRRSGTTGTIVGAVAGGLLGRARLCAVLSWPPPALRCAPQLRIPLKKTHCTVQFRQSPTKLLAKLADTRTRETLGCGQIIERFASQDASDNPIKSGAPGVRARQYPIKQFGGIDTVEPGILRPADKAEILEVLRCPARHHIIDCAHSTNARNACSPVSSPA